MPAGARLFQVFAAPSLRGKTVTNPSNHLCEYPGVSQKRSLPIPAAILRAVHGPTWLFFLRPFIKNARSGRAFCGFLPESIPAKRRAARFQETS